MAFRNIFTTLVANTATKLVEAQAGDVDVWVNSDDTTDDYFIGGDSSVGFSSGLRFNGFSGNTFYTKIRPGDEIWVISPSALRMNAMVRSA